MASDQREKTRSSDAPNSEPEEPPSSQSQEMVVNPTVSSSLVTSTTTDKENPVKRGFSKYMTENCKIHDGPPARYQLKPERVNLDKLTDEESNLGRFSFGNHDPKYPNKTILLVGATGSGKSTLVNALVNFVMGVKFEDKVWFEIIGHEKDSQTTAVCVYEVFGFEETTVPYSLTIIDTPGYGQTKGIEHDQIVGKELQDLFCVPDGVDTIDAVGLVLKATDNRLDERMAYIFNSVTSIFGKNMEKNIVAIMTHSDGVEPTDTIQALEDAQIKCARNEKNKIEYFLFNNSQTHTFTNARGGERAAQYSFETSENGTKSFIDFLRKCQPQSLKTTVEVMEERNKLNTYLQELRECIRDVEEKQQEIKKNEEQLKHQQEMENFECDKTETYKVKERIDAWWDNKAVTCNKCEETCHYPGCTWALSPSVCVVMQDGRCTVCSGKCPAEDHVKKRWRYVTKTRTVTKISEETKAMYEQNKTEHEETTLLEKMKKEMTDLQQTKNQCLDETFEIIEQLEKIALNVNAVTTYVHLEFLIEKMKEKGDTEKVQKLEIMKDRMDEKNKPGAMYLAKSLKH